MIDPSFRWKARRRRERGLTQPEEAGLLGVSMGMTSHLETGKKAPGPELRKIIHEVYAYGTRGADEPPRPVYLLALIPVDPAEPEVFLCRADGQLGWFLSFELADTAARLLRQAGVTDAAAVPAWPGFVGDMAARVAAGAHVQIDAIPETSRVSEQDGRQVARRIFEHVAACLDSPGIAVDLQRMLAQT